MIEILLFLLGGFIGFLIRDYFSRKLHEKQTKEANHAVSAAVNLYEDDMKIIKKATLWTLGELKIDERQEYVGKLVEVLFEKRTAKDFVRRLESRSGVVLQKKLKN